MVWSDWKTCKASGSCNAAAGRKFYSYETNQENKAEENQQPDSDKFLEYVGKNIIGSNTVFDSPFGPRKGNVTVIF